MKFRAMYCSDVFILFLKYKLLWKLNKKYKRKMTEDKM